MVTVTQEMVDAFNEALFGYQGASTKEALEIVFALIPKAVPRNPTEAMSIAGDNAMTYNENLEGPEDVWRAMWDAYQKSDG